jgi:hypothetical protein
MDFARRGAAYIRERQAMNCPETGMACEKLMCKKGSCYLKRRIIEAVPPKHSAVVAIVERMVDKLKYTNPKAFRQPKP